MKLSLLFTFAAMLLLLVMPARAQIAADTVHGIVGGKLRVAFTYRGGALPGSPVYVFTAIMQLSNPTVFYPEQFTAPTGAFIESFKLLARNDSVYEVTVELRRDAVNPIPVDSLFYLEGEALAGSDSVCTLTFRDAAFAANTVSDFSGEVITHSVGPQLPYVRFAILEQNYPNPVPRGVTTTWAYRIDKRSDVRFEFYDPLGQQLFVTYLGDQQIGPHTYALTPQLDMPSGAYLVRLVTNSGTADKLMMVLR